MPEMSDDDKAKLREEIEKQRANEERLAREAKEAADKIRKDLDK